MGLIVGHRSLINDDEKHSTRAFLTQRDRDYSRKVTEPGSSSGQKRAATSDHLSNKRDPSERSRLRFPCVRQAGPRPHEAWGRARPVAGAAAGAGRGGRRPGPAVDVRARRTGLRRARPDQAKSIAGGPGRSIRQRATLIHPPRARAPCAASPDGRGAWPACRAGGVPAVPALPRADTVRSAGARLTNVRFRTARAAGCS